MSLVQRFRDWRHERHICRLSKQCSEAYEAGDKAKARHFLAAIHEARQARSPAQVRRMEEGMVKRLAPADRRRFEQLRNPAGTL